MRASPRSVRTGSHTGWGKKLYGLWCLCCFIGVFLLVYPFFLLIIPFPAWHRFTWHINKTWAVLVYALVMMPVKMRRESPIPAGPCIFCANHNSYLDIPIIGRTAPHHVVFMGKSSLNRVPLFGFMFRNLHIPVNRESRKASYQSYEQAKAVLERGHSLLIFPEGGIKTQHPPRLASFKEGAFRLAIEKQVPIVPVSIVDNWQILFDNRTGMSWHPNRIVYHTPIPTAGLTMDDLDGLKAKVHQVITAEMRQHFPEHFQEGNA